MSSPTYDTLVLSLGSTRLCKHNFTPVLESGVSIDSVTSVSDVTNSGSPTGELTISNVAKTSASYTEDVTQDTVSAANAVQFTVATSATVGKEYLLKIIVVTDGSPAETIVDYVNVLFPEINYP